MCSLLVNLYVVATEYSEPPAITVSPRIGQAWGGEYNKSSVLLTTLFDRYGGWLHASYFMANLASLSSSTSSSYIVSVANWKKPITLARQQTLSSCLSLEPPSHWYPFHCLGIHLYIDLVRACLQSIFCGQSVGRSLCNKSMVQSQCIIVTFFPSFLFSRLIVFPI